MRALAGNPKSSLVRNTSKLIRESQIRPFLRRFTDSSFSVRRSIPGNLCFSLTHWSSPTTAGLLTAEPGTKKKMIEQDAAFSVVQIHAILSIYISRYIYFCYIYKLNIY